MPKISVIVPVYNGEKFISETLDSLVNQTLSDIEVLVVDDGSLDKTRDIVTKYCEEYPCIKYIYQKNAGVSAARNAAIPMAQGEYTVFLDSDDIFTRESLEGFYNAAKQRDADLVIGRLKSFGAGVSAYNEYADKLSQKKEIKTYDKDLLWNFLVGNKCYKTEKLQQSGVIFPRLTYSEEGVFFTSFVYTGAKITGTENSTMCYRRHTDEEGLSVSQSVNISLVKNFIASLSAIYDNARDSFERNRSCENEEEYLQEIIYKTAHILLFQFYRHFWRADDETLSYIGAEMKRLVSQMNGETKKRFEEFNSDICVSPLCISKEEVASSPKISVIIKKGKIKKTVDSVFESSYPYFEVFVPESCRDEIDEKHKALPNLNILPDKNFIKDAKVRAKGEYKLCLSEKDIVDDRIFRFLIRFTAVPAFAKKLLFTSLYKAADMKISK